LSLAGSVVARTKSRIACFAGPLFQEINGPSDVVCASAGIERTASDSAGSRAMLEVSARRLISDQWPDFIIHLLQSLKCNCGDALVERLLEFRSCEFGYP
jgi:hypothetical protein